MEIFSKKEKIVQAYPRAKYDKEFYKYLSHLYDNLKSYRLNEQKFKKMKKIFYHISRHFFDVFRASSIYGTNEANAERPNLDKYNGARAGLIFLSPKMDFCIDFFKLQNKEKNFAFLYKCQLLKELDLFNASSKKDILSLKNVLSDNDFAKFVDGIRYFGNDRFWSIVEEQHIINAVFNLGYDGLCSFGNGKQSVEDDFHNAENIGIFDPGSMRILSREKINIRTFKKNNNYP